MEPEDMAMRVAYFVLFITLALMSWALSVQSVPLTVDGSPCSFNLLCSCTKPGPRDFGIVSCHNVPFSNFPTALNTSARAFILSMAYNDLRVLEAKQLVSSGLWRLEVRHNDLYHIEDEAFWGLTKFLAELDLSDNKLTDLPRTALQSLIKLRVLNFNGNQLADLSSEDWEGFPNTLTRISLANNLITNLPELHEVNLPYLEWLDLNGNSINHVHPHAFFGITQSIKYLDLSGNLLRKLPFEAVEDLKLENLDVSQNLISSIVDMSYIGKLSLGSINLALNQISSIPFDALQNFRRLNSINLSYNPISIIGDEAFKGPNLQRLDLSHCYIQEIYPGAFHGLGTTLRSLDLGFNNMSYWPLGLFSGLAGLRKLVVENNRVGLGREELVGMQLNLQHLSLLENKENLPGLDDLRRMGNLRELNLSSIGGMTTLTPNLFHDFGPNLQRLKLSYAKINTVMESPFAQLTGLKVLDLSENRIGQFNKDAFQDMGHSITSLILSNALRSNSIPTTLFHPLVSLEYLDLSSNTLVSLPEATLEHSGKLTNLNLRFNKLASLPRGLLDPEKIPCLEQLSIGFNQLNEVDESTFAQLRSLQRLELNDNVITTIHKDAFQDLTSLEVITLAGNRLSLLEDEAFTNLPHLHLLDLSHNQLRSLNIEAFEQVGTLSSLTVDASWNKINTLGQSPSPIGHSSNLSSKGLPEQEYSPAIATPTTTHHPSFPSSSSIEILDFSHNNISYVASTFFAPISHTLLQLDLSWNSLTNLTHHHLSGMRFLQRLRVDWNALDTLEYDTFQDSKLIQVISLDNNFIRDLPPDLLEDCTQLRVFSVQNNKIRSLADPLLKDTQLEILNVAGNQLVRFPEAALSRVSSSLVHLDLSSNELSTVALSQIESLKELRWLSLKNNRITVMGDTTFSSLPALLHLDISGNPKKGHLSTRMFVENRDHLLYLNVANMSLKTLPDFDTFSNLITFNASHNLLTFLPTNFGVNMSSLRTLDLSGNEILSSPNTVWHTIPRLQSIFLGDNPIRSLTNDSFLQLDHLHYLDISELPLKSVQTGILWPMSCLKFLKIGPRLPATPDTFIHDVDSLQHLHLVVEASALTPAELGTAKFPPKLSKLTLSGPTLTSISDGLFQGVTSRSFHLTVEDTGLVDLAPGVVSSMGDATDITLEVGGGNSALSVIGNPNQKGRPQPFSVNLLQLLVQEGSSISCSCDSGWIEFWIRQWMARTCIRPNQPSVDKSCDAFLHGFRTLRCENKSEMGLMQAFVTELECGWDSRSSITGYPFIPLLILMTTSVLVNFN